MTFIDDMLKEFLVRFLSCCRENDIHLCNKEVRGSMISWRPLSQIVGHDATDKIIEMFLKGSLR